MKKRQKKQKVQLKKMAKRRKSGFIMRAKRVYKRGAKGLGELFSAVKAGAIYGLATVASGYLPFAIDARIKRLIVIAGLYLMGGAFRQAAKVGIAMEIAMLVPSLISGTLSLGQAAVNGF